MLPLPRPSMVALLVLLAAGATQGEPRPQPRADGAPPLAGPLPRPNLAPRDETVPGSRSAPREPGQAETGLCGSEDLEGERLPPIKGEGGCGAARPVRLTAAAGMRLEPAPELTCRAARTVARWLVEVAKPAFDDDGPELEGLGIAGAYVCRNVNDAADGDLSEHARGRAIDIARFERADGSTISVLDGWASEAHGPLLRAIHEGACGLFGTTLGPDSDAYHADHFHYDVADRRRPYCP